MIKAISLFSGAGGMDVGFKSAGVQVLLANEIDKNEIVDNQISHPIEKVVSCNTSIARQEIPSNVERAM